MTDLNQTPDGEPPDADEIYRAVKLRMAVLRPLVEEHERLTQADAAIDKALAKGRS